MNEETRQALRRQLLLIEEHGRLSKAVDTQLQIGLSAIASLLVKKGIITSAEFVAEIEEVKKDLAARARAN